MHALHSRAIVLLLLSCMTIFLVLLHVTINYDICVLHVFLEEFLVLFHVTTNYDVATIVI